MLSSVRYYILMNMHALLNLSIVLDMHYQINQRKCVANQQYYAAFLIEILRVLMEYCPSGEIAWSREALDFSLVSSFNSFTNVSTNAKSM